jgi:hypothetical protein
MAGTGVGQSFSGRAALGNAEHFSKGGYMDEANFDLICGIIKCVIGVLMIVVGLFGLKVMRRFFGAVVASVLQRRPKQGQRGFAIAPVLYLLGLIGVLGGVMFSNFFQILKSGQTVQNAIMTRTDMQAAANTLSAEALIGSDGITLCPPRSVHQTAGNVCAAAPVVLVQFADFTGNQLPANYASAGTTGSPTEVGVFTAGSGTKVLDPYGHTYIYCRWENPRSNPAAPAFVLLSAGADGRLQTRCGDSDAQGDDKYLMLTVATMISRATLWQSNGSNVTYGTTGSQVTIDNNGNITTTGNVNSLNAAITNGITASTLTTSGNITSSGNVTGASGSFTNLSGNALNISGTATVIGTSILGSLSAGASTLNSLSVANSAIIGNSLTATTLTASGTVSGATGSFTNLNGLNATITNGVTAANLTASGTVTGATGNFTTINGTNEVLSNNLTAVNVTASNTVMGANGNFTNLNATNATITGTLTLNGVALGTSGSGNGGNGSQNLNVASVTASGAVSAATGTFTSLTTGSATITGNETVDGNITVVGIADLNKLGIGTATPLQALDVYDGGIFVRGARTVPSAGAGLVLDYGGMSGTGVAGIEAYDYGAGNPLNLTLQPFGGRIGIGTTNPDSLLEIFEPPSLPGPDDLRMSFGFNPSVDTYNMGIATNLPTGRSILLASEQGTYQQALMFSDVGSTENIFAISSSSDAGSTWQPAFVVNQNGYVGIGTAAPSSMLEVSGDGTGITLSMAGFQQQATDISVADSYANINADDDNAGGLFLEGISNSRTESGINMDGTVADTALNPGQPAIQLSGEKLSGNTVTSLANNELILGVENMWNTPLFVVSGGGNVGIGTTTPQATLDINGVMKLAVQTAAPATCKTAIKGTVAMTTHNGLCFCNGSAWEKVESPTTACAW